MTDQSEQNKSLFKRRMQTQSPLHQNSPNNGHIDQLAPLGLVGDFHRTAAGTLEGQSLHPNIVRTNFNHGGQIVILNLGHRLATNHTVVAVLVLHALDEYLLAELEGGFVVGFGDGEGTQEDVWSGAQGADGEGGLDDRTEGRPRVDGDAFTR